MPLELVLGKMPQKTFSFTTPTLHLLPLDLRLPATPSSSSSSVSSPYSSYSTPSVLDCLHRVLRLLDVGSKRFLTNKVDRSVTGLVARQQCVGPLQLPLSDVAVLAQSPLATTGVAVSVGEQPIKGLLNPAAQGRLTVGEALTNLVWARVTSLSDLKSSCNWMWAAKMEGEGAKMWRACKALTDLLLLLGPSIDGGKDSLSMAARVGDEVVKSPGQVTLTVYGACPDITQTATPDFKYASQRSAIVFVDLSGGYNRLGGTALSTVFAQLGDECPDVDRPDLLKAAFEVVQDLLRLNLIAAGHDRSDGGLVVTLLEMAFAGNCGLVVDLPGPSPRGGGGGGPQQSQQSQQSQDLEVLFSEELGLVMEVKREEAESATSSALAEVLRRFADVGVPCREVSQLVS